MWEGQRKGIWTFISALHLLASVAFLTAAIALDCSHKPYCSPAVEQFFTSLDRSTYISTSLVIWTFGTALLIYFMGRMGDRCFGIRYYEALLAQRGKCLWVCNLIVFFGEIVLLEIVASLSWPITLFVISMLQLLNAAYIFFAVLYGTSQGSVVDAVKDQNRKILGDLTDLVNLADQAGQTEKTEEHPGDGMRRLAERIDKEKRGWLLFKVMRNLNYNSYEDIECLADKLLPRGTDLTDVSKEMQLLLFWKLGSLMLGNGAARESIPAAMDLLFADVAVDRGYSPAVKKGLLAALAVRGDTWDHLDRFQDMLERIDDPQRGPIIDWCCGLMKEITTERAYAWKRPLLDQLKEYGPDYGCQEGHVLEWKESRELAAFVDYLTHSDEDRPDAGHVAGATREEAASHV